MMNVIRMSAADMENFVGMNGMDVVEMAEIMGLDYEICYYDDHATIAGIDLYGIGGCDCYSFECDDKGIVEFQGEGFYE